MNKTIEEFIIINGYESEEIDDNYEMLKGPNGFECVLSEPEDRTFSRDLSVVVNKLDEQYKNIQKLKREVDSRDRALKDIQFALDYLKARSSKDE